jgi:hypothetical protein
MADHVADQLRDYLSLDINVQGKTMEVILREFKISANLSNHDLEYLHLSLMPLIEAALTRGVNDE